jgi:ubiquinol-cytochrome c reductase cytochrome c subunit
VRFLSTRRRHPAAKLLLLVLGLFVMGALYTVLVPATQVQADTSTSQQVAQGKALFAVGCASCHGLNGEGQVATGAGTDPGDNTTEIQAPPLAGVGAAAVDFQVSSGRMPLAKPEAQAPVKPNRYTPEEVAALEAYVASLGPGPDVPAPADYNPANLSAEDVARGGELFRTNCSACHNFEGAGGALPGGKYAPSLYGVPNRRIYEALITGPQQMPVFSDGVMRPEDKRAIIAYLNTLHAQPNEGGLSLGGLGPVSEGLWAWILGLGSLMAVAVWIAARGAKAK